MGNRGNSEPAPAGVMSRNYRLLKPGELSEIISEREIREGDAVIEPTLGSICHADLRYYTGQRRPEALARKLPLTLIHEGIGRVLSSRSSEAAAGRRVVIVPNIPGFIREGIAPEQCCPACRSGLPENYCHNSLFLGSSMDGIAQHRLVIPAPCALPIPDGVPDEIAVLAELCSVSVHALSRVAGKLAAGANAIVFGDGPVGYFTAAMLHHVYGLERDRLRVFGAIPDKINQFAFAGRALVQDCDFRSAERADIAIECTGGRFSESAINQAIDILKPGGSLILMGVTEERVPVNTRDTLEKGITLLGSSRSTRADFVQVLETMRDLACQDTLRRILPDRNHVIRTVDDFREAMEETAQHKGWKKTVLEFRW
ncbi:alcohol dehydrogenase catalytic domain-containing protein [Paenibacillus hodogayensis]|uniref:Alcohol dehydrogenase catalytic domain-containing protein n=1 Tax=Paenibacillus hodogayensis TaxID=279208 RepID=A0ABV5W4T8_9BACL